MGKKITIIIIALLISLLGSVLLNIHLAMKNNELNTKINSFIPAAMDLENENSRLLQKEQKQQQTIDELSYFKDSINIISARSRNVPLPAVPSYDSHGEPITPAPTNTERTFKDLNKGN